MAQHVFHIDGRGRTFNPAGVEVKLSPAMQSLVRALNVHGYIDPIRDFGRRTGVNTAVALMDRGILREARSHRGVHFPVTTPAQVWDEAHDENARRDAERAAHAANPESWVQTVDDSDADEVHIRMRRDGSQVRILSTGFRFWRVYFPGQSTSASAGGTWQEARAAADRYERNEAHDAAIDEDDARSVAQGRELLGWGQPDGMLGTSTELVWTFAVGDSVLYRADNPRYGRGRVFGRVLLVDGINIKVQWPGGVDWHHATALEHHPMPSDAPVRAKLEAQNAAADALLQADLRAGRADGKALPIVPNTPAEARTGISDRAAAALADVAEMRSWTHTTNLLTVMVAEGLRDRLDRIEAALRHAGKPQPEAIEPELYCGDPACFYLQHGDGPSRQVTKAEWVAAERAAGFRGGSPGEPSTGGFGNGHVHGTIRPVR